MVHDPVASRYAQALFESAKTAAQRHEAMDQLETIGSLLTQQPILREFMWNPDVDPDDKVGLLDRTLKGGWPALVKSFIHMVVSMGRSESLPQIVEAFREAVDASEGRLRVLVRSARPVSETSLNRLRAQLEAQEHKTIEMRTELAPELLGGVQIHLDHRVIDGSVRRQLDELREQLSSVRVH